MSDSNEIQANQPELSQNNQNYFLQGDLNVKSIGLSTATHYERIDGDGVSINTDALIIGAGFGGMYSMYRLRKLGLNVKIIDAAPDFGGTWCWNRYPGARVDSETPFYSLSIPEVFDNWHFSERYPGSDELRRYFDHVDKVLGLRKDAVFNNVVVGAKYDTREAKWHVETDTGLKATAKYLICCTGSSYKKHFPKFKDLHEYKGRLIHSAAYPDAGIDVRGKKVGVIGSGATGVQIIQELAKEDCDLTAFVRTPNIALPMRQRKMTEEESTAAKNLYSCMFQSAKQTYSGFPYTPAPKLSTQTTAEERQAFFEMLWKRGGFSFLLSSYPDFAFNKEVNSEIYQFWAKKTRSRITDPAKRDILVPKQQPHWLGTKRSSLEQNYFEMMDRPNVKVVNLQQTPIVRFEEGGIRTSDALLDFDIVILATGFDALTGSLRNMGLVSIDGIPLEEQWAKSTTTYLGLTIPRFPNMFLVYSPQAPTSLSNGPAAVEVQVDWIADAIGMMMDQGIKYIDAQQAHADKWRDVVQAISDATLMKDSDSWYTGANIEGKTRETLIYLGGLNEYERLVRQALKNGKDEWSGFDVVSA